MQIDLANTDLVYFFVVVVERSCGRNVPEQQGSRKPLIPVLCWRRRLLAPWHADIERRTAAAGRRPLLVRPFWWLIWLQRKLLIIKLS